MKRICPARAAMAFAATVLVALWGPAGCGWYDAMYSGQFPAFGGLVDVTIVGVSTYDAQEAVAALAEDFSYLEKSWNDPGSGALGRTNQLLATGESFSAPPAVLPLLREARDLAGRSDGLLNPAQGALRNLWGFYTPAPESFRPPAPESVAELLAQHPVLGDIAEDGFRLRSGNPAVALDFESFLKGYAIDRAVDHLRELGVENALINAGGDLRAIGSRAGHPWRVAVRRADGTGVLGTIDIAGDESLVSVGSWEKHLTWQGVHYHHILDPRTGWPAERTRSVTVLHSSATVAQAAATALFVAGPTDWPAVAARMGVDQVLLIDTDGVLHVTPALEDRLNFVDRKPPVRVTEPRASAPGTT